MTVVTLVFTGALGKPELRLEIPDPPIGPTLLPELVVLDETGIPEEIVSVTLPVTTTVEEFTGALGKAELDTWKPELDVPDPLMGPTLLPEFEELGVTVVSDVVNTVDVTGMTLVTTDVVVTTLGVVSTEVVPEEVTVSPIVWVVTKVDVLNTVLNTVTV